jgi:hypothetical protein
VTRLCACPCGRPIATDHPNAIYASDACKTRAYRARQENAAQASRVTPERLRKPVAQLRQVDRVERALILRGPRGITRVDFILPNVMDGGAPILHVGARVEELRKRGLKIDSDGPRRKKCAVYVLEPTGQLFAPDADRAAA